MKKILIFYLFIFNTVGYSQDKGKIIDDFAREGKDLWKIPGMSVVVVAVSYTHLTLPTNREV